MRQVEASVTIAMSPGEVMDVFINQEHLREWWGVDRSLIELKHGGLYSLVWHNKNRCIQYVSSGVVEEYLPACQLRIGNLVYINPERPVLGPTELLILTTPEDDHTTQLTVVQSGYQSGPHWNWLYEAVKEAWPKVLEQLKTYAESVKLKC